jgi:hypothetical protein
MNQLIPCPGCNRHVRQAESSCPFCSAALSLANVPAPLLPRTRLGRAATFAFGATLVGATTLVACGGVSEEKKGGDGGAGGTSGKAGAASGGSSAGTQASGGTGIGPVYGAPAGGTGTDVGGSSTGGKASGGSSVGGQVAVPAYGAPAAGFSGIPVYGAAPPD